MSARRGAAWVAAIAAAGALYIISIIVAGEPRQNGAWLLMVIVFVAGGVDVVVCAFRNDPDEVSK